MNQYMIDGTLRPVTLSIQGSCNLLQSEGLSGTSCTGLCQFRSTCEPDDFGLSSPTKCVPGASSPIFNGVAAVYFVNYDCVCCSGSKDCRCMNGDSICMGTNCKMLG